MSFSYRFLTSLNALHILMSVHAAVGAGQKYFRFFTPNYYILSPPNKTPLKMRERSIHIYVCRKALYENDENCAVWLFRYLWHFCKL